MDCKYPKYWNKETRLNSFHNWSFTSTKSPQELAEAGFFYTGEGDSVKCFHCGMAMYMLKKLNSCAWKLHCKFSNGKCEFLKSIKSQDFINRVMARRDEDNVTERDTSDTTYQDTNKAMDCKYPKYWNKETRLNSYYNWSFDIKKSPEELADAGFFYTGNEDKVTCFFCGVTICSLQKLNSCAWKTHCKFTNGCEYAKRIKGQAFIDNIKANIANMHNSNVTDRDHSDTLYQDLNKPIDCKHPKYWNKSERLKSYHNWNFNFKKAPEELADAGFFYTGEDNKVKCFCCGNVLSSWTERSCLWKLHCKLPNADKCEFLKFVKGVSFISDNKTTGSEQFGATADNPTGTKNVTRATQSSSSDRRCEHPKYWNKSERLKTYHNWSYDFKKSFVELNDAGFFYTGDKDKVTCFSCGTSILNWKETDCVWEEHVRRNSGCDYVRSIKGQAFIDTVTRKTNPNGVKPSAPTLEDKLCKICFIEEYDVTFLPCGHVLACQNCAPCVETCPLCRVPISSIKKIYFS